MPGADVVGRGAAGTGGQECPACTPVLGVDGGAEGALGRGHRVTGGVCWLMWRSCEALGLGPTSISVVLGILGAALFPWISHCLS